MDHCTGLCTPISKRVRAENRLHYPHRREVSFEQLSISASKQDRNQCRFGAATGIYTLRCMQTFSNTIGRRIRHEGVLTTGCLFITMHCQNQKWNTLLPSDPRVKRKVLAASIGRRSYSPGNNISKVLPTPSIAWALISPL